MTPTRAPRILRAVVPNDGECWVVRRRPKMVGVRGRELGAASMATEVKTKTATNGVAREQILGQSPSKKEILERVQTEGVEFVDLQFTDVMGIVKSVTVPAGILGHIIDGGQWIDGS